jgi:hypothetical protein
VKLTTVTRALNLVSAPLGPFPQLPPAHGAGPATRPLSYRQLKLNHGPVVLILPDQTGERKHPVRIDHPRTRGSDAESSDLRALVLRADNAAIGPEAVVIDCQSAPSRDIPGIV